MGKKKECVTNSARHLLNPRSELSQRYPALHYSFHNRLREAWALRGHHRLSKCIHATFNGYDIGRSDGETYQMEENGNVVDMLDPINVDTTVTRVSRMCNYLGYRMEVYGILGSGTFGVVYLAREKPLGDEIVHPYDVKHFAIKVERHTPFNVAKHFIPIGMVPIWDPDFKLVTYIPTEALALFLLTHSERFPMLDSVYTHDRFESIVMSPCVDSAADRRENVQPGQFLYPSFTGKYLLNRDGTPLLNEMQACKVASQLLQGMVHMAEFNIVHVDMSVNNFIVDQNLDVQLIDLGNMCFGTKEESFIHRTNGILPFQEYQITPALAEALLDNDRLISEGEEPLDITYQEDHRFAAVWKFGVILYGMLHGFWPWDTPEDTIKMDLLDWRGELSLRVLERRIRMQAFQLPFHGYLTKECREVLEYIFHTDDKTCPLSLESLVTFPWFQRWLEAGLDWERPHSARFERQYAEAGAREA